MKFAENTTQAAEYLRQAIPLMVKHNIPPNPLNYALWYAYVSKKIPELNQRLDETLSIYGTCPDNTGQLLFRDHMIKEEIKNSEIMENSFLALLHDLSQQTANTAEHTRDFSQTLHQSLEALQSPEVLPMEEVIKNLSQKTEELTVTTSAFQKRMDEAQKEIQLLKAELNRAREDAVTEPLTGLYNRRAFDNQLAQLIEGSKRGQIVVILIDIDHFKRFNDRYGHLMGDKVLQYVAKILKDNCPETGIAARFGGEEFIISIPDSTIEKGAYLAEKLREKIHAIRIKDKKSGEIISSISASFGVARHQVGENMSALVDRADTALYQAKDSGRNRVVTL